MKLSLKLISVLILILLSAPVILLLKGCGKAELGSAECPSGSVVANSTDKLTGPPDATLTIVAPSFGGSVIYSPLVFTVTDVTNAPRNNVCVVLYTDGFFFTDDSYSTLLPGGGPMSRVAMKTNNNGSVYMYWSTEILPASGPNNITSDTWVTAYSGSQQAKYSVAWTVNSLSTVSITTTSPLTAGVVGTPYSVTMVATGGTSPYTWADSGGLPPGLSLSAGGVISGTPTLAGTYSFTITATDTVAGLATASFTIVVT